MSKLVTGKLRASFVQLDEPNTMSGKYQLDLLIPKDHPDVKRIKEAIDAAIREGIEKKWNGKKPQKLYTPLKEGDEKIEKANNPDNYTVYEGMYYITPSASKPNDFYLFDRDRNVVLPDEFYSGCYVRASIEFYPWFNKEFKNNGVSVALRSLQFISDGTPLGGGRQTEDSARSDFDDGWVDVDSDDEGVPFDEEF